MAEQVLNVTGLAARVEDKQLLHGVDLTINKGETHVLMGPNGTGGAGTVAWRVRRRQINPGLCFDGCPQIYRDRRPDPVQGRGYHP